MADVFINYRQTDTGAAAIYLAKEFRDRLGESRIFLDKESIPPGRHFPDYLHGHLISCKVMLVLIGDRWLGPGVGEPSRLFEPDDYVRREIEYAMKHQIAIVPVLVHGATMPAQESLPEAIRLLTEHQYRELPHQSFEDLAELLVIKVGEMIGVPVQGSGGTAPQGGGSRGSQIVNSDISGVMTTGDGSPGTQNNYGPR